MADWNNVPFIGLSATPWTKGLGKHYDDLIQVTTTAELIERGYLSPFRVYGPSKPDLSKCRTVAGDYNEQDLSAIMDEPKLVADVVETWCKNWGADKTLCFAVDRAHARHLAERFESVGISTGYVAPAKSGQKSAMHSRPAKSGQKSAKNSTPERSELSATSDA